MSPFWYNEQANQKKVSCATCKNMYYNMLTGKFYCNKKKYLIPTREPEEKHICKDYNSSNE